MRSELSKTVATFILRRCLLDNLGLSYICTTPELCFQVVRVLGNMVGALAEQPSSSLLKHIISNMGFLYITILGFTFSLLMCDISQSSSGFPISVWLKAMCMAYGRACDVLRTRLPLILRDTTFSSHLRGCVTKKWLQQLLHNVDGNRRI
ncbi:hypothetical protein P3L10_034404 [Capsicum annuum]